VHPEVDPADHAGELGDECLDGGTADHWVHWNVMVHSAFGEVSS
jgi:hypothetical protein